RGGGILGGMSYVAPCEGEGRDSPRDRHNGPPEQASQVAELVVRYNTKLLLHIRCAKATLRRRSRASVPAVVPRRHGAMFANLTGHEETAGFTGGRTARCHGRALGGLQFRQAPASAPRPGGGCSGRRGPL